jgi:protein-S-isoprenylcysteine O-methyltransferase Ste14
MGRSWRIGIDPAEKLELVSIGPYRWVRHPIYATRMGIDVCAWVMLPTVLMGVTAGIDILLMQIEARREETYMLATHGAGYENYMARVGRFLPRPPGG